MKKIGFIDYYLDEFHANHYPGWIAEASKGTMKVTCAYGKIDKPNGRTNAGWCEQMGIQQLATIEEVVEQSDGLVVLSPDNPELHEELSELALKSGKPTYIDKTFAPDRAAAERLFALAAKHGTPMYSTSALRYAAEYANMDKAGIDTIHSIGPGTVENYSVHQIEPIVHMMGAKPERVMFAGTLSSPLLLIDFGNGRQANVGFMGDQSPFAMAVKYESGAMQTVRVESDCFELFIQKMVQFFDDAVPPVPQAETEAIISIIENGIKAMQTPFQWREL